jgi:hypothetical protein
MRRAHSRVKAKVPKRIVRDYAPCDLVLADIEAGTPDDRVLQVLAMCEELSRTR